MSRLVKQQFNLSKDFLKEYSSLVPPFGFNGLGELVYIRTYSRLKSNGKNERWYETVKRVVEGTYSIQKKHIESYALGWNEEQAQRSAEEMYDRMFNMKFLPPGRGLWAMGTDIIKKRGLAASLNNCAFVSTKDIGLTDSFSKPFTFLMDMCMLGVGVGFDTKGADNFILHKDVKNSEEYSIPDTREGWVKSTELLIDSFNGGKDYSFDYSKIRPAGTPLKTFGGISSGPQPLIDLHIKIGSILSGRVGEPVSTTTIVDLMNLIGKCVVAGNVRRTAEIAFGEYDSQEFMNLKNYARNPHRSEYGWTSNNSIFAKIGMDYSDVAQRIIDNGEPGLCWLDNMRKYSRMNGTVDNKDSRVCGGNPCLEQSLESYELCCLCENFPSVHDSLADFLRTLKFSFLYAKTVTLGLTHWPETNRVQLRNRRIGCSVSGIAQFLTNRSLDELKLWLKRGYSELQRWDINYSEWFAIPRSIKLTSVKPSGTVSLLAGATPGMHYPESRFYLRRMRLSKNHPLVEDLMEAGYHLEDAVGSEHDTTVVGIPVDAGEGIRTVNDISMWEQLSLAAFLQRYWSDNQVSATITFSPELEGKDIKYALDHFQYRLKGISFLPKCNFGAFPQMPYEEITEEKYSEILSNLKPLKYNTQAGIVDSFEGQDGIGEYFCDGDKCVRL